MTGQGNKDFERITQRTRSAKITIDVTKQYRTASGLRVRGLHETSTHKTIVRGQVTDSTNPRVIIKGQVWMKTELTGTQEWMERAWDVNGNDLLNPELNLVEYKPKKVEQPKLFSEL